MTITPRERMLMILLSAVVILVGGSKLFIEPQLDKLAQLAARESEIRFNLEQAELDLIRAQTIDQENRTLEAQIIQGSARFFPELSSDMVQLYFDNLARAAEVSLTSFAMTAPAVGQVTNPPPAENKLLYPAGEAANRLSEQALEVDSAEDAGAPQSNTGDDLTGLVEVMQVSLQLQGSYQQALALLGQISGGERTLRVSSVYLTPTQTSGIIIINITAECYGVKKFAAADSLSAYRLPSPQGQNSPF